MKKSSLIFWAFLAFCLTGWSGGFAAEQPHQHAPHHKQTGGAGPSSCRIPVHVTEEAERQPGGALYAAPAGKHPMAPGQSMAGMKGSHSDMKGAHMVHKPQQGGAFFMAPDKIHHLEGLYSDKCGFQVLFYNAFTKPIHVDRFQAFIKAIPKQEDEPEITRFLSPSEDRTVLKTAIGDEIRKPFLIELLVKFPESDEPVLFSIQVPGSEP